MKNLFTLVFALFASSALMGQIYVNETFEGGFPADWSQITNASDGGFLVGTAGDLGSAAWGPADNGGQFAATNDDACDCDKSMDYLILPVVDVSGATELYLDMDVNFGGFTYGNLETAYVEYSTDGGTTWEVVTEIAGSGSFDWVSESWDLSSLVGASELWVAVHFDDGGGWLYGLGVDNVKLYSSLPGDDVQIGASVGAGKYNLTGGSTPVDYTITNVGGNDITSLDVTWTDGTNTYTDNLNGLSLAPGQSMSMAHDTELSIADAVKYELTVSASNPNGVDDPDMSNNSVDLATFGIAFQGQKRIIAEEATGTWCGWCPRGFVFMEQMAEDFPETFIGLAVHNGDPMVVSAYDGGLTSFPGFSGFPSVVFDRQAVIDPSDMPAVYNSYITQVVPADVVVSVADFDPVSRELSINAKVTFATQMSASDYRLNVILEEDGVTGTGAGFNQANYYAGGGAGDMGGWESLPGTVSAADMVYDDVARDILGGWAGFAGSEDVVANQTIVWEDTYIVPADWDENNLHVIFTLIDGQNGEYMTGDIKQVGEPTSVEAIETLTDISVTPNPTQGLAELQINFTEAVDVNIDVLNSVGQTVYSAQYSNTLGDLYQLDLTNQASGVYHVRVVVDGQVSTERIVLQR